MLLKQCNKCGRLMPYGSAYCSTCLPIVQAEKEARIQASRLESNKRYNKTRDPRLTQFYNSIDWKILSAKRLQGDGYRCVWCRKIATEVDHIKEISTPEGWELRLDYDNLRSLCHNCHNRRHGRFMKKKDSRIRP